MVRGGERLIVRCYVWNITHGGYPRNPNEMRIQITGIDRIRVVVGAKTLLLGWSEDEQMFAGFDATKHLAWMAGRSPSLQVRRETLAKGMADGLCPQTRDNEEIVVAFRPDFFGAYVEEIEALHGTAKHAVDVAHIIPVEHERGTDETKNGICLSALHHRAFDLGLFAIARDYRVVVSEQRLGDLRSIGWDGGESDFRASLRDHINLPARSDLYPDPDYLFFGQQLRGWPARLLR
jgi:hypothetical protein